VLKHPPADPDGARVFADLDPEFDSLPVGVPTRIFGECEKHCDLQVNEGRMFLLCPDPTDVG
jgi:hypothetical protein